MTAVFYNDQMYSSSLVPFDLSDRGLLLGDGVFETLRVDYGKIHNYARHWQRLIHACRKLNIDFHVDAELLKTYIVQVINANELRDLSAAVRVTVTRGGGERGLLPTCSSRPTLFISASARFAPKNQEISAFVASVRRNEYSVTSQLKTLNYLDNIIAKVEAQAHQADEAVLLNTRGHVACASAANIYIVRNHVVFTPPVAEGALPGIVRSVLLDKNLRADSEVKENIISIEALLSADEIFISNSLMGIVAVTKINEHLFVAGPITSLIQKAYEKYMAENDQLKKL